MGYFLKKDGNQITCQSNKKYVLILPSNSEFEIDALAGGSSNAVTVCFFIKIYGFTVIGKVDIIYFSEHMKLSYDSDENSEYFGLNLVSYTGSSETVLSNYRQFRIHVGVWTFISVATYDKSYEEFFPQMIRFEVNQKAIPVINLMSNNPVETIKFNNQVFALVQRLRIFSTYILGAHTYVMNKKFYTLATIPKILLTI